MSNQPLFRSDFAQVDEVDALTAEGKPYRHARVTPRSRYGGVAIPFMVRLDVLWLGLVRQFRPAIGRETLEFPRGITNDLTSSEAAREMLEETGMSPSGNPLRLGTLFPDTGLLATEVSVWAVRVDEESVARSAGHQDEHSGARTEWLSSGALSGKAMRGEIVCGMTLASLALFRLRESAPVQHRA